MQIITETELLDRIAAFLIRHGMARTTFGRKATGNANLVRELEDGKSPSLRTAQRIAGFMDQVDAEAATQAKLQAPLEPLEEEEHQLPFSNAPVNRTGASSPTSSSTNERRPMPPASDSCLSCSGPESAAAQPLSNGGGRPGAELPAPGHSLAKSAGG